MRNTMALLALALGLAGCDSGMTTPDSGPPVDAPRTDSFVPQTPCMTYCTQITTNCSGMNAQYLGMADCLSYCAEAGWPDGTAGAMSGNTLACRIYHGGMPAQMDPAMHCPHAGPTGAAVCGTVTFSTDMPAAYTIVDGMGLPAVSTALLPGARKNAYNDLTPDTGMFTTDIVGSLTALHMALDDDLAMRTLIPCTAATTCVAQGGPLLIPADTLQINPAMMAGFPNGRALDDQVIDIVLSTILLDHSMGGQTPRTLADIPLNPGANDLPFLTAFPYVAAAHPAP